jgi:hypothetical protein
MTKSAPAQTTTTVNPAQQAQQPYLSNLYQQGLGLFNQQQNSPLVGQIQNAAQTSADYAQPSTYPLAGYAGNTLGQILQGGTSAANLSPAQQQSNQLNVLAAQAAPGGATQGNVNALGQYAGQIAGLGSGLTGIYQPFAAELAGWGNQVGEAANPMLYGLMNNPAATSLFNQANGAFLGPNPYLSQAIAAAQDPSVRSYETATAPQLASNFETAGRYGGGAMANAQDQAQKNLGYTLANIATPMAMQGYQAGLQNMLGAGNALGGIYNQGMLGAGQLAQQGFQLAGNMTGQAANLAAAGPQAYMQALQNAGALQQAAGTLTNQGLGVGTQALGSGGQLANAGTGWMVNAANAAPALGQFPQQEYQAALAAPWLPFGSYSSLIGGALPGSNTASTPMYQNVAANILGTGLGGLQLANSLNTATQAGGALSSTGAIGSLFSGTGLLGSAGPIFGAGAGAGAGAAAGTGMDLLLGPEAALAFI